ncbi:MAG: hypothetical protein NVS4B6_09360 [Mycobacterium sp.]
MTGEHVEPVEQRPVSDWTDQDLLTKEEARERLVDEIGRTRRKLAELERANADGAEIMLVARRLDAMESIRDEYGPHLGGD